MEKIKINYDMKLRFLISIFAVIFFTACMENSSNTEPKTIKESVLAIPDSAATPEQLALRRLLEEVSFSKVVVKEDRLILVADSAFFIEKKIPLCYLKFLQESLDETSDGVAKWKREGLDVDITETYERSKKEYWEKKSNESIK